MAALAGPIAFYNRRASNTVVRRTAEADSAKQRQEAGRKLGTAPSLVLLERKPQSGRTDGFPRLRNGPLLSRLAGWLSRGARRGTCCPALSQFPDILNFFVQD